MNRSVTVFQDWDVTRAYRLAESGTVKITVEAVYQGNILVSNRPEFVFESLPIVDTLVKCGRYLGALSRIVIV
jgi:hypothetical protein